MLVSILNADGPPDVEPLPMCRLLQSMNSGNVLHEVRRLRIIRSMERAGCRARHADGCGFDGRYSCPCFKERPIG